MRKVLLLAALTACAFLTPTAHAASVICRGGNAAAYAKAVKSEIGKQLTEQGASFSAVVVTVVADDRRASKQSVSLDVSGSVGVTVQPLDVIFEGELPAASSCKIPATLRVRVFNGNVAIVDKTFQTAIHGTLLSIPARP